jgi:preprotein translocase subunit YajC
MTLFSTPAYAQDATGGLLGGGLAGATQFLPIVLIFIVFYFLLIRPQQQRQKALKAMVAAVKRGDRVVTAGGIVGVVQRTREGSDEIEVEIAPNVRVQVVRDTISTVLKPPGAANDATPPPAKHS